MVAEKSPASVALEKISRRQKNLKRKIGRAEESGDLAKLVLYHAELVQIGRDLDRMKVEVGSAERSVALRRSYRQEFFSEDIHRTGVLQTGEVEDHQATIRFAPSRSK
jgi:hypothetical protein